MAEFKIVMHEMRRMCETFTDADECQHCPLVHSPVCGTPSDMMDEAIRKGEAAIMAWAAEHPEPQYPLWWDYLFENNPGMPIMEIIKQPIPADIAKKLGVEPK